MTVRDVADVDPEEHPTGEHIRYTEGRLGIDARRRFCCHLQRHLCSVRQSSPSLRWVAIGPRPRARHPCRCAPACHRAPRTSTCADSASAWITFPSASVGARTRHRRREPDQRRHHCRPLPPRMLLRKVLAFRDGEILGDRRGRLGFANDRSPGERQSCGQGAWGSRIRTTFLMARQR